MIVLVVLLIINYLIYSNLKPNQKLVEVREKYKTLREHLIETDNRDFEEIYREIPLVAYERMSPSVGYNTNKGQEIGICIDGDVNEIFHVLLHELAHCAVDEYTHSEEYWKKFDDLKKSLQKTKSTNKPDNDSESDSDKEESDDCDKQYMLLKPKRQKL